MNLAQDRGGLWIRPGNDDHVIVREMSLYSKLPICEGDVVLDVGAHIGAFTCLVALAQGAEKVIAVEPDPDNLAVLMKNVKDHKERVTVLPGAVTAGDEETVTLWQSSTRPSTHTSLFTRGRLGIQVSAFNFAELLKVYQPQVVKMDIEGGEYALERELFNLPQFVEALAIELHPCRDRKRERSRQLVRAFERQFTVRRAAKIGDKNWTTMGVYARGGHLC